MERRGTAKLDARDLGRLNIEWVDHTEDPLFRDLTRNQRYALYLTFVRNLKLKDLSAAIGKSTEDAKRLLEEILILVRQRAAGTIPTS